MHAIAAGKDSCDDIINTTASWEGLLESWGDDCKQTEQWLNRKNMRLAKRRAAHASPRTGGGDSRRCDHKGNQRHRGELAGAIKDEMGRDQGRR